MTTDNAGPTPTQSHQSAESQSNVVPLAPVPEQTPIKKAASFVHDHPVMTLAGGLAIGAVAAALIPKRNRAYVAKKSTLWAEAVAAASAAIAQQTISQIGSMSTAMRDQAETLASRAGEAGHAAKDRIEDLSGSTLAKAQELLGKAKPEPTLSEKLAEKASDLRGKLRR